MAVAASGFGYDSQCSCQTLQETSFALCHFGEATVINSHRTACQPVSVRQPSKYLPPSYLEGEHVTYLLFTYDVACMGAFFAHMYQV